MSDFYDYIYERNVPEKDAGFPYQAPSELDHLSDDFAQLKDLVEMLNFRVSTIEKYIKRKVF